MHTNPNNLVVSTTVKDSYATVTSELFEITIEVDGKTTRPSNTSNFALWLSVPIAMTLGRDIHIDGVVSVTALENARTLVEIWSKWHPTLFSHIAVNATTTTSMDRSNKPNPDLMLYSGGVDSTYSLLKNYVNTQTPVSLLTIHGMDYKSEETARFNELKQKISSMTSLIKGNHYFVRSNAPQVMSKFGIDGGIGHGFQLFGSLFIFEDDYGAGAIAADCTPMLDFIITPWGTNHLTNQLYASEKFFIKTLDNEIDRAEKIGRLMELEGSQHALAALTFCKDRRSRPHNCGICSKCVRTKAMFYTEIGTIPDIFSDRSFKPRNLDQIDLSDRGERALVLDILASARRNGKYDEFSWLDQRIRMKGNPKSKPRFRKLLRLAKKFSL